MMKRPAATAKRGRPAKKKPAVEVRPADIPFLTIDDFCNLFAIRKTTFYKHKPKLTTYRFGGRTLIRRDEALRYIESFARPPAK